MFYYNRSHKWKVVHCATTVFKRCSRCHNDVNFYLVSDIHRGFVIGWPSFGFELPITKAYALNVQFAFTTMR